MDFTLCKVTFGQLDTCHCQRALINAMHIPSHARRVQCVQISEYFLIRNYIAVKKIASIFLLSQ
jgi:hypothetical protein